MGLSCGAGHKVPPLRSLRFAPVGMTGLGIEQNGGWPILIALFATRVVPLTFETFHRESWGVDATFVR
jgi:hypothetical protein